MEPVTMGHRLSYSLLCRISLSGLVLSIVASSAAAQLPRDCVMLYKLKISEKQKSIDLCPVYLKASDPKLSSWTYKGVTYRAHKPDAKTKFEEAPDKYAEAARAKRWENNFVLAMSTIWCPVTDEVNPGGGLLWKRLGIQWESCCAFCNEDMKEGDFPVALALLKQRALLAYKATGGRYAKPGESESAVVKAIRSPPEAELQRLLYVASPGIRNYLQYGGHGILVFDIDQDHKFLRRIPIGGLNDEGKPLNIKGVCASEHVGRLFVSTLRHLICLDLVTDKILWEKTFDAGCDRMSISPDGTVIYLPSLEKDHWKVIDSISGDEIARVTPRSGAHNTVYGRNGKSVFLAGLRSPLLTVAETKGHTIAGQIGPFGGNVRPFTVNSTTTRCYVNVNELLGFEVGDLKTGKVLHRVEVEGFEKGPIKRHGCPSHGIGLTPDDKEIWVSDGANSHVHIFDVTTSPPSQLASIKLRYQPGWVTFSLDGTLAYPSTGEVIDTQTRKIIAVLEDEEGRPVQSEKMLEIDFRGNQPMQAGDQFGFGRLAPTKK
jgi:hypothetical protein